MARTKGNDLSKKRDEAIAEAIAEAQAILDEAEEREKKQKEEQEARVLKMILYQWKEFAIKKLLEYFESCDNGNDSFTKYKCSHYYCTQEGFHIDDDFYDKFRRRYRAYQRDEITRRQLLQEAFEEFPQPSAPTATPTSNIPQEWPKLYTRYGRKEIIRIYEELRSKGYIKDGKDGFLRAFCYDEPGQGQIVWIKLSRKKVPAPRMILEFIGLMAGDSTHIDPALIKAIFKYEYSVKTNGKEEIVSKTVDPGKGRILHDYMMESKSKTQNYDELRAIVKGK